MYKLLIVDDEQSVRYSFKKLFNSSNYTFNEASNADEAIASFKKERPSLVILDIEMPGRDGIQVLKELKELSPTLVCFRASCNQVAVSLNPGVEILSLLLFPRSVS